MKKVFLSIVLLSILFTANAQLAQWKKQVIKGSVMTAVGTGMIGASAGFMLPYGSVLLFSPYDGEDVIVGGVLVGTGAAILLGGIALDVVGPIMIARGVRRHKDGDDTYLQFAPIPVNPLLDKYNYPFAGKQKFAAVTLTF